MCKRCKTDIEATLKLLHIADILNLFLRILRIFAVVTIVIILKGLIDLLMDIQVFQKCF